MNGPGGAESDARWLTSGWRRLGLAALVASLGFALPQEVPLIWCPLDDPGQDILYLEIKCAADQPGDVQVFYNATRGINELDVIRWPMSGTTQTYTYTFPLADAPLTELRLDPVAAGGTLTVSSLRIIDRRGTEVRRFTRDDLVPVQQIVGITPLADGWKITSTAGSNDPFANIRLPAPILAKDLNHRNLLRCLLSGGYLALILWVLLLAVPFVFHQPSSWRDGLRLAALTAMLSLMFSAVGNRGLIKNSVRYARFMPPSVAPGVAIEIDLATDRPIVAQVFWDLGKGFNERDSVRANYAPHTGLQTLRFPLPAGPVKALRFDPVDSPAHLAIRGLRVVDAVRRTLVVLPLSSLEAGQDIDRRELDLDALRVDTTPSTQDPILLFAPSAIQSVQQAQARGAQP